MRNHSYENDLDLHENETACRTHFYMKGSRLRLVLKQRHKRTRKWPMNIMKTGISQSQRVSVQVDDANITPVPPEENLGV